MIPYIPNFKGTIRIDVTTTPQTVALPTGGGEILHLMNDGNAGQIAFLELGDSNITVREPVVGAPGGTVLHPISGGGDCHQYRLRPTDTHIAIVAGNGTPPVYVTRGKSA